MNSGLPAILVTNLGKCYPADFGVQNNLREKIYEAVALQKNIAPTEKFWALRNIDFEIPAGEVVGIIGANGAGKSTLLKLLAEVTEPTEGSIQFNGKVISILEIGTGFHPDLTGTENIHLSGSLLGMSQKEIDEKISSIIEFSELGVFINRPVKYFSSGMFLRLAFSVCTHLDADILLLDEVISVGDAAFSIKSLKRIREIAKQGKTILLASHDLASVQHVCTQCILLEKGNMLDMSDTSKLVERYIEEGVIKSLSTHKKDLSKTRIEQSDVASYLITHKKFLDESDNPHIRLKEMHVLGESKFSETIHMNEVVTIKCVFEKLTVGETTLSCILNYNLQQNVMSAAHFNNMAEVKQDFSAKGIYTARCIFPAPFFNHGIFSISVYFTDSHATILSQEENVLIFRITHSKISSGTLQYDGKYNGALYPKLNWEFEKK